MTVILWEQDSSSIMKRETSPTPFTGGNQVKPSRSLMLPTRPVRSIQQCFPVRQEYQEQSCPPEEFNSELTPDGY